MFPHMDEIYFGRDCISEGLTGGRSLVHGTMVSLEAKRLRRNERMQRQGTKPVDSSPVTCFPPARPHHLPKMVQTVSILT